MTCYKIHSWSLIGLVRAFFDLAVVYFLLCISAALFIPSKILEVIGLCLPCPCTGFYGYRHSDLCLYNLLIDWPWRRIYLVLDSVKSRFPFDLILNDDHLSRSDRNLLAEDCHANPTPCLQSEACCSAFSSQRLQNLVDKDSGCDGKGKRVMYQRPRTRIRRRKRVAVENGKFSNHNLQAYLPGVLCFPCGGDEAREEREPLVLDNIKESNHIDLGEKTWHGFESSSSIVNNDEMDKVPSSIIQGTSNGQESGLIGNESSSIKLLEHSLEKEKAARASLYLELEKERAAAATAADEAIAMISRLQNDRAAIEMEARHYQRLIEEKFAYDEEEMNILREILVRREIDNHVLEKEIEAYMQMGFLENELAGRKWGYILDECKQLSDSILNSNGDPPVGKTNIKDNGVGNDREVEVQDIHVIDEKLHIEGKKEELHQMIPNSLQCNRFS